MPFSIPGSGRLAARLATAPFVARLSRRLGRTRGQNRYYGVFTSFAEALAAAPKRGKLVGYDHALLATFYRERLDRVHSDDYPALYWLARVLPEGGRVFDFGGHVGLHRYGFAPYLASKARAWTVCDVRHVVEAGRGIAKERGALDLDFTERLEDADGADVFFASGSLQYLGEGDVVERLIALRAPPRHVIVNKTPVHDDEGFVTLQDTGVSVHAYTVFGRGRLVATLERHGWRLVDAWRNPEHACRVLLEPGRSLDAYSGFAFSRA